MPRPQWTVEQARAAAQASVIVRRKKAHSPEWKRGYSAGWKAYERYLQKIRLAGARDGL